MLRVQIAATTAQLNWVHYYYPTRPCLVLALRSRRQKTTTVKTQCTACHANRDNVYGGPYAGVICGNCLWTRFGACLKRLLLPFSALRLPCSCGSHPDNAFIQRC